MDISPEFIDFIERHKEEEPASVLLKYGKCYNGFSVEDAVTQIKARKKSRNKIPSFINAGLLFPDSISSEQASDERVASYHAQLMGKGHKVIDMTAGLGIDAMTIARNGNDMTAVELDATKAQFLKRNAELCGIKDLTVINADSTLYVRSLIESEGTSLPHYIFIDPARRNDQKKRVYALKDCLPDITEFYEGILQKGVTLFIKVSPLLDLTALNRELIGISSFHIVSVKGECKEILIVMKPPRSSESIKEEISLWAVDLDDDGEINYSFHSKFDPSVREISPPIEEESDFAEKWLYEPGAAIMKILDSCSLNPDFPNLRKLNKNTSLFISDILYPEFPGRKLKIIREISKKDLKALKGERRNVTVRNYPLSAEELKKKLKTLEGTDLFIYGCRVGRDNRPILLECQKIND